MRLIAGQNEAVAKWVAARIPFVGDAGFGACTAVGVVDREDRPICGVVFHDWQDQFKTLSFSIAADSPRWASRSTVKALLAYPFEELKIEKLWTITPHKNLRALRMLKFAGFTQEAVMAKQFGDQHAVVNRMFRKDYVKRYGGNV